MQDCKLHLLRWKFLPKLAALLYALAGILTAPEYQDRYVREMGHEIARAAAQMGAPAVPPRRFLRSSFVQAVLIQELST